MTDNLSIAERIVEIVLCRLQGISQGDGYRTDAGLRVFDSRRSVDPSQLPAIFVFEGDENPAASGGSSRSYDNALQISVQGHVLADSDTTGKELRALKADIKKAVMVNRGDVADSHGCISQGALSYTACQVSPRDDGDVSESVQFTFTVNFKEGYGDPYKQL